jgi:hypothetical protein
MKTRHFSQILLFSTLALVLAGAPLVNPGAIWGQTTSWTGNNDNNWFDDGNWTDGVPDSFFDVFIDNGGNPSIDPGSGGAAALNLTMGSTSGASGLLNINDHLAVAGTITVGGTYNTTSAITHEAGTVAADQLVMGRDGTPDSVSDPNQTNYYFFDGGTLQVNTAVIGDGGYGYFLQRETTSFQVAGNLVLGNQASGGGMLDKYGGDLHVGGNLNVGLDGMAAYYHGVVDGGGLHDGGSTTVNGDLVLGANSGSMGYLSQLGGAIAVLGDMTVGDYGTGAVDHAGGTLNVAGRLYIGAHNYGAYNLSGTGVLQADSIRVDQNSIIDQTGGQINVTWEYDLFSGTVTHSGGTTTASFMTLWDADYNLSDTAQLNLLDLWIQAGGTFNQSGGTLGVGNYRVLGGTVQQTGGMAQVDLLAVGQGWTDPGAYNVIGGVLNARQVVVGGYQDWVGDYGIGAMMVGGWGNNPAVTVGAADNPDSMIVGHTAARAPYDNGTYLYHGLVTQWDGQVTVYGELVLGLNGDTHGFGPAVGIYELNGGTVTVHGPLIVGSQGTGAFYLYSGSLIVDESLRVGDQAAASGNYGYFNQLGGNVSVGGDLVVGNAGDGFFAKLGGDLSVNNLVIGASGYGSFYHSDGTTTVRGSMTVGDAGIGEAAMTGGTLVVWSDLAVGRQAYSQGAFELHDGYLDVQGSMYVGDAGNSVGAFTQYGGYLAVRNNLVLGSQPGSQGAYALKGGFLEVSLLDVGHQGTGTFSQSAGFLHVWNDLRIGVTPDAVGAFYQSAGTTAVEGNLWVGYHSGLAGNSYTLWNQGQLYVYGQAVVGHTGLGTFTQAGASYHYANQLILGHNVDGVGYYNLNQGTLDTGYAVIGNAGYGQLDQWEGVLNAGLIKVAETGTGLYNLYYGQVNTGALIVGGAGDGTFNHYQGMVHVYNHLVVGESYAGSQSYGSYQHTGGTTTVDGALILGQTALSSGEYAISNNAFLYAGSMVVGDAGWGLFFQGVNGGWSTRPQVYSFGDLILGSQPEGQGQYIQYYGPSSVQNLIVGGQGWGSYELINGTLEVRGDLIVGQAGSQWSSMVQGAPLDPTASSAVTVLGNMIVGQNSSGNSRVDLYAGSALTVGQPGAESNLVIAQDPDSWGTFNQQGGTLTVNGSLIVGHYSQAPAGQVNAFAQPNVYYDYFYYSPGVTRVTQDMVVGNYGNGLVIHKLGSIDVAQTLILGHQEGSYGEYRLNMWHDTDPGDPNLYTGVLKVVNLVVGNAGTGEFQMGPGGGIVIMQMDGEPATSRLNADWVTIGQGLTGVGNFTQYGGIHTVNYLMTVGLEGTGTYTLTENGVLNAGAVDVGYRGFGTFNLMGGSLTAINQLTVGVGDGVTPAPGVLNQSGGVANVGWLEVGRRDQSLGIYNFSGGSMTAGSMWVGSEPGSAGIVYMTDEDGPSQLTVNGNIEVGSAGAGQFYQYGGSVLTVATGSYPQPMLRLGLTATGQGTYQLHNGSVDVGALSVGFEGVGDFWQSGGSILAGYAEVGVIANSYGSMVQSGGDFTIDGAAKPGWAGGLTVGRDALSVGVYEMNEDFGPALLTTGFLDIGSSGQGTFTQRAGTINVTNVPGNFYLGRAASGSGTYNLEGGSLGVAASAYVGASGAGFFNQTGGSLTVDRVLFLGYAPTGNGIYTLDDGTITAGRMAVGGMVTSSLSPDYGKGGTGFFTQKNGSVTLTGYWGTVNGVPTWFAGNLMVGRGAGSQGTYDLQGGTVNAENIIVGGNEHLVGGTQGTGNFLQSGGSVTAANLLLIGTDPDGSGNYSMSNGTLLVRDVIVGSTGTGAATGSLNLTNAAVNVTISNSFTMAERGSFGAAPGVSINLTGSNFYNESHQPGNVDMTQLRMFFSNPAANDTFEVAGLDLGAVMTGFVNNFALGTLDLDASAHLQLVDLVRNLSPDPEALYVTNLIIGDQVVLDFSNLHLYYQHITYEGAYEFLNGAPIGVGMDGQVPIPGSVLLLGSGLAGLIILRRRMPG